MVRRGVLNDGSVVKAWWSEVLRSLVGATDVRENENDCLIRVK
jgi:hypothetical protein